MNKTILSMHIITKSIFTTFQSLQSMTNKLSNSFGKLLAAFKSIISPLNNIVKVNLTIFSLRSTMATQFGTLALRTAPVLMQMAFNGVNSKTSIIADLKRRRNTACTKRVKSYFPVIGFDTRIMEIKHIKRNCILTNT